MGIFSDREGYTREDALEMSIESLGNRFESLELKYKNLKEVCRMIFTSKSLDLLIEFGEGDDITKAYELYMTLENPIHVDDKKEK